MKNLFIHENSGYGRFVTVTVNGRPYTVPVGVNTSVPDEVYAVVMESLKKPEMDIGETKKRIPTDITLADGHLQLTANDEAFGNGVELPTSGFQHINTVTIDDTTSGATTIKITQDEAGKAISLSSFAITGRIVVDASVTGGVIRLRTDSGNRYLYYRTIPSLTGGSIELAGFGAFSGGMTVTNFCTSENGGQGIYGAQNAEMRISSFIKTPIRDVELFLLVGNTMQPLLAGSMLSISGV